MHGSGPEQHNKPTQHSKCAITWLLGIVGNESFVVREIALERFCSQGGSLSLPEMVDFRVPVSGWTHRDSLELALGHELLELSEASLLWICSIHVEVPDDSKASNDHLLLICCFFACGELHFDQVQQLRLLQLLVWGSVDGDEASGTNGESKQLHIRGLMASLDFQGSKGKLGEQSQTSVLLLDRARWWEIRVLEALELTGFFICTGHLGLCKHHHCRCQDIFVNSKVAQLLLETVDILVQDNWTGLAEFKDVWILVDKLPVSPESTHLCEDIIFHFDAGAPACTVHFLHESQEMESTQ